MTLRMGRKDKSLTGAEVDLRLFNLLSILVALSLVPHSGATIRRSSGTRRDDDIYWWFQRKWDLWNSYQYWFMWEDILSIFNFQSFYVEIITYWINTTTNNLLALSHNTHPHWTVKLHVTTDIYLLTVCQGNSLKLPLNESEMMNWCSYHSTSIPPT